MPFNLLSRPPVRCIRDLNAIDSTWQSCALTIGSFRSLHAGHRFLITTTVEKAVGIESPAVALSLSPSAHEVLSGHRLSRLLNSATRRLMLARWGINCYIEHRPDAAFLQMPAERFVEEILIGTLRVRRLVIGDDFRFGHKRAGGIELLRRYESAGEFSVTQIPSVRASDQRISTTAVERIIVGENDYDLLRAQLGRPWSYCGRVCAGQGRGRQLGSPTLNIPIPERLRTPSGVFAGIVDLPQRESCTAAINIGTRPTLDDSGRRYIEAHLLDAVPEHPKRIAVHLLRRIRPERRFANTDELRTQIAADITAVRSTLSEFRASP